MEHATQNVNVKGMPYSSGCTESVALKVFAKDAKEHLHPITIRLESNIHRASHWEEL